MISRLCRPQACSGDPTTWITIRPDGSCPHYRYAPYRQEPDEGFESWGCPDNPDYVKMMEGRIRGPNVVASYVERRGTALSFNNCSITISSSLQDLQ